MSMASCWQEERSLTPGGSVRKRVVKQGSSTSTPPAGACVFVAYEGRLKGVSGKDAVFDSTHERGEFFSFTLGQEQTVPGLEMAVATMTEGEIALITIEPGQAFGSAGNPHGFHGCGRPIPPDSTLQFELQLLDWQEGKTPTLEMSYASRLELAEKLKAEGNTLFVKQNEIARAVCKYKRAIALLDDGAYDPSPERTREERAKQMALSAACNLNLAACQLKQNRYKDAAESCREVLKQDENNVKARFRLGKALVGMNELEQAKQELLRAAALEDLAEVKRELKLVEQKLKMQEKKQQQFYGKLFSSLTDGQGSEGLYSQEELDAAKRPTMKKCRICGEEVEEVQLARHVIKKHSKE